MGAVLKQVIFYEHNEQDRESSASTTVLFCSVTLQCWTWIQLIHTG